MTANNPDDKRAARLAQRLTGPAAPEIGCDECFDFLDYYVELELARADADARVPGMKAHLEGCSACRADHDSMRALLLHDSQDAS
jgi:predicted anti-sigma-YlaC factor YlaD